MSAPLAAFTYRTLQVHAQETHARVRSTGRAGVLRAYARHGGCSGGAGSHGGGTGGRSTTSEELTSLDASNPLSPTGLFPPTQPIPVHHNRTPESQSHHQEHNR